MEIVPIMLLSYMMLGMLFNVSMWYKLSGKTSMAIYITLSGLVVTVVVNVLFMPLYSYWAAAFAHLASYLVMFIVCAVLGQKYYPIPYRWGRIAGMIALMLGIYGCSLAIDAAFFSKEVSSVLSWPFLAKFGVHTLLIVGYLALAFLTLRRKS